MSDEKQTVENEDIIKENLGDNDTKTNKKKTPWQNKLFIILLLLITCSSVTVTYWALFIRKSKSEPVKQVVKKEEPKILEPDVKPEDNEKNAESMGDAGDKKLDQPKGGGAVSITYSKDVTIDLSDKTVSLLFGNPTRSNQSMVLQIVIQDNVIVQSDTLAPGYQVKKLDLKTDIGLKPGTYKGKFNILYYDSDTGKKAVVNTEIPIDINVQK